VAVCAYTNVCVTVAEGIPVIVALGGCCVGLMVFAGVAVSTAVEVNVALGTIAVFVPVNVAVGFT
jgi:hypothetical protein